MVEISWRNFNTGKDCIRRFDDLIRLVASYDTLLEKYELVLKDVEESRAAAEVVLRNAEILQVALGEVHKQVLDAIDPVNVRKHGLVMPNLQALKRKTTLSKHEQALKLLKVLASLEMLCFCCLNLKF